MPDGDDGPVLFHAHDRVVAPIDDIEVRVFVESRVARPVDVICADINGGKIDRQIERIRTDALQRTQAKHLVRGISGHDEIDDRDRVVERLGDEELPHDGGIRIGVHDHSEPRRDIVVLEIPIAAEDRPDRARGSQPVEPLLGVLLGNSAIGGHDGEYGPAAAIGRRAEQRSRHCAGLQRASYHLRLHRHRDPIPVGQFADIDAANLWVWGPGKRQSGRIKDRGRTHPHVAEWRICRPDAAKGVVVRQAERAADPGILSRIGGRIIDTVQPVRAVGAEHLHRPGQRRCLVAGLRKILGDVQDMLPVRIDRQERALQPSANGARSAEIRAAAHQDPTGIQYGARQDVGRKFGRDRVCTRPWRGHVEECADLRDSRRAGHVDGDDAGIEVSYVVCLSSL